MSFNFLRNYTHILTAGLIILLSSCVDSVEENQEKIDRKPLLENLADKVIIPAYTQLNTDVTSLNNSISAFVNEPNETTLARAKSDYLKAYLAWQKVEFFDFGPAFDQTLRAQVNTFPTDNFSIENNVNNGTIQLESISNRNKKGFPAIDYLLFGEGKSTQQIVESFSTQVKAQNRRNYLKAISEDLKQLVSSVYGAWNAGEGNYRATFIQKDGTDVGSSLGQFINALSQSMESFTRDAKIGIPLGKRSQGVLIPKNSEAYYSGNSIALASANVQGIQDAFRGASNAQSIQPQSLLSYLDQLGAKYNGADLSSALDGQLQTVLSKMKAIPDPYSKSLESQNTIANEAYLELQKTVILVKVDLASALGILISYQDNDGD